MGQIHCTESIQLLRIKVLVLREVAALVLAMEVNEKKPLHHGGSPLEPEVVDCILEASNTKCPSELFLYFQYQI